jgi:hypothetical protein
MWWGGEEKRGFVNIKHATTNGHILAALAVVKSSVKN